MNGDLPWWAEDYLRAARIPPEGPSRGAVAVRPGIAEASIEGRGFQRASVTVEAPVLRDAQWDAFFRLLEEQALLPAALLAGYLPQAGRQLLASRRVRLAPPSRSLRTEPGRGEIAATAHRAIAAHFAEDPLRLLHFRGRRPEEVLERIEAGWACDLPGEMSLGDLGALLDHVPDRGGLLPAVQQADAFRDVRLARVGLARLFDKVSERVAAMNRPPADDQGSHSQRSAARIASRRAR